MIARSKHAILLGVAVVTGAFALFLANAYWRAGQTTAALEHAFGPVETVMGPAARSHCPWGSATHAFLAQGPRSGGEVEGYVCTSWWRKAQVRKQPLDHGDNLDWD